MSTQNDNKKTKTPSTIKQNKVFKFTILEKKNRNGRNRKTD